MKQRKILIATTNQGKLKEIKEFFATLDFEFVSLQDVGITDEPEEPFDTVELNAYAKAKFYGEKSGLLSLSDDAGLFIEAANGWPGAKANSIGANYQERIDAVLTKLQSEKNRKATLRMALALYDPVEKNFFISIGENEVEIALQQAKPQAKDGLGYDLIYYYPPAGKTFSEMTVQEKNQVSHRGKALHKMEYILKKEFGARHLVVPCGFLIQDGKMYLQKRNDPFRPDFHAKWEFPGGGVEFGEQMIPNLMREVKEETGFEVEIVKQLNHIQVDAQEFPNFSYQVYLVPYVCKIVGGKFEARDHEVMEGKWFDLDEVPQLPLVGNDKAFYEKVLPELKEIIKESNL